MWNKREKEVAQAMMDKEQAVLKALEKHYRMALEDVNLSIRILQSDEQTQSKIHRIRYQETLKKQLEGILEKLHTDSYRSIQHYLNDSYTDAFVGVMYDLHGQDVPVIAPIDQNAAIKAIQLDTKLSERKIHPNANGEHVTLYESLGVDVDNLKKTIRSEITRGISTGMKYEDIARNVSMVTKAPLARAKTIVRTEGHRIQQASQEDARQAAKARGADVVKQWDSTLDGETRSTHRHLDGQIREVNEPFTSGTKEAMFPGDFGDPALDCNCRCTALTRARKALDEEELATMKERAEFFRLDKSKEFNDFKQKYLNSNSEIKQAQEKQAEIMARRAAYKEREARKKAAAVVPDFGEMSSAQIKQWTEQNLNTVFEGVNGANRDFVAETARAVATFERKMGGKTINGLSVKFGGVPNGVVAKYDDTTKTLLLKKSGSLQAFTESQEKANARYRLKWRKDKDYYATTTFSGTVFHELGHAVDIDSGQALSRLLSVDPYLFEESVKISVYAGSSQNVRVTARSEAFAENFAAYMEGGENAKKVPKEIIRIIEDYFIGKH